MGLPETGVYVETVDYTEKNAEVHSKTLVVAFAVYLIYFAQLVNIVGSGAYARSITAVVGGAPDSVWLTQVLAILTVVLSPPVSQAADYWGRKWFLVGLTACGIAGSIIVSRANSIGVVILGFTIGGLSFGAQPLLHAVISEVLPRRYRPYAQGSINVSAALGAIFALLVGGALTRNGHVAGFRTYWYISAAVYAVATAICTLFYNPPPRELQMELNNRQKFASLDWIGYLLLTFGLVLFCLGLSWSQSPYPWTNPHVLATFLVGTALVFGLVMYEWFFKRDGMLDHRLFRNRNFPIALTCVFVEGVIFFSANNYFAFEISVLYTSDPLRIGLHYSINFWVFAVSSILSGAYCSRAKQVRLPTVVAFALFVVFNILMATIRSSTSENALWAYPVLLGIPLGMCLATLVTAAQFSTPPGLIAITSGLMIGMRSLGGSVGLAIYNAIFNHEVAANLAPKIAAAVLPLGLPEKSLGAFIGALASSDTAALPKIPGVTPEIIGAGVGALKAAYTLGFRYVWVAAGCLSAVALILAFFLYDPSADFNAHIDAPVEQIIEPTKLADEMQRV